MIISRHIFIQSQICVNKYSSIYLPGPDFDVILALGRERILRMLKEDFMSGRGPEYFNYPTFVI